ncbi:MAG: hypothetical protein RL213_972 [Bacteroidota bacterium]|jgi:uncharacterized protein (DUF1800 family)
MNRRDFLTGRQETGTSPAPRTFTGLAPYTGPWTLSEVKHLLRRTVFGANKSDCNYFLQQGMAASVAELLTPPSSVPSPPLYVNSATYNDPNVPFGQTWVNAPYDATANAARRNSLRAWWTGLMIDPGRSVRERMVLLLHSIFVVEIAGVFDARYAYTYLATLRQYALGNYKDLTRAITLDPAMLRYLNGYLNSATAPDENYGRELQELFTVGKDSSGLPYYTEDDVQAAARVLTGYRINFLTGTSYFDSLRHDTGNKQFSAYYNNTVIYGQTGAAGANELDDLLNMIFARPEVALNICRKIYRHFVYYSIDAAAETDVIQPLAVIFRNNNYELLPVLQALLSSEHFYDMANRGAIIKPPVDFAVGLCRDFEVSFPSGTDPLEQYTLWQRIHTQAGTMGQIIGDPPDVAGWPAYYSAPQYHELWINASTLPARSVFVDRMLSTGYSSGAFTILFDTVAYTATMDQPGDPDLLVQEVLDRHYCFDVSQTLKDYLKNILLSGQTQNYYWTNAWDDYTNNPSDPTFRMIVETRLNGMYSYVMKLAEYHLS